MSDVFVSYKAEDRARIAPLVQALQSDGVSVWWDEHIGAGEAWRQTILRQLESAKCVLVVWSKRSVGPHGEFVRDEAARAVKRKTYFPIRIDRVDPPLGFGETQALDLSGWKGDTSDHRYEAVLNGLRTRFGVRLRKRHAGATPANNGTSRRGVIAGGAAAAVLVAGGGTWLAVKYRGTKADSIAVLPFANLSGDPNQAYFSDGIAEELRSALSRIAGLKVVARTSSEAMRNADAKTAAAKLGVARILTGSVRRSASTLRISAELVDENGLEQWSEAYDRPSGDALQIQADIASRVADALRFRLTETKRSLIEEGGTANAAAQDLLLKVRDLERRDDSLRGAQQELSLVNAALALDPTYGDALAAKARVFLEFADTVTSVQDHLKFSVAAEQLARQAVAVAPRSISARGAFAGILYYRLKIKEARRQYEIMTSLPGFSSGNWDNVAGYAYFLQSQGEYAKSLEIADRGVASDPLNPWTHHGRAQALFGLRRYAEAKAADERALALAPNLEWPKGWHALILMEMGKLDQAKAEFRRLKPSGVFLAWEAILEWRRGNRAESDRLLAEIRRLSGQTSHVQLAEVLAQQGGRDEAIAELELAWTARDGGLQGIQSNEMLAPLRADPRFHAIVKRLDFPT